MRRPLRVLTPRSTLSPFVACLITLSLAADGWAAPEIGNLSLRGLQTGATTSLVIDGSDLLPEPRVLLPVPVAAQIVQKGATPNRVQIDVTLADSVPPGIYPLRIANAKGISRPIAVGIDSLLQVPVGPIVASLPAAAHGTIGGSATVRTSFAGKKSQKIVVEVEAVRLGAVLDPLVELHDGRDVQIAWSQGLAALNGDARLEAVLPADGTYGVVLRDALYNAGSPGYFRLKIGELHYADFAFPLGGQRGTKPVLQLLGNLPEETRVTADLTNAIGDVPAPLPKMAGLTGPGPRLFVSDLPEVVEAEQPKGKLQEVTVPAVINGRIGAPREEDRYRLLVKPGMGLRFDVVANRAGSPLDGVLTLYNEAGATLTASDDRPDTVDPGFDFTVPEGVKSLVLGLTDLSGRGGPNYLYRIGITLYSQPDFSLSVFEDRHLVPQAGTAIVRVRANRTGYNGPIKLSVHGAPPGLTLAGEEIPASATDTLLSLTAPPAVPLSQVLTHIEGAGVDATLGLRRVALLPDSGITRNRPWLRAEFGLAVTEAGPLTVAWENSESVLALGTPYTARVRVTRSPGSAGAVRLALLTSQVVPRTPDGKAADMNRAVRIEGTPMIAADQPTGTARVLVPGDLPMMPYDLAVRAELLSPDGKQVLATAFTPSRRFSVHQPFSLQLAGTPAVEARSGLGPTGKLAGKVVRQSGFDKPVTVTLAGLPAELPSPSVQVPGIKSDFELPVAFPFGGKLGDIPNVRLVATSQLTPQQVLRSNEIAVTLKVVKGEPPPPPPPLRTIFEDEAEFLALLTEGDGQATLETTDRYSGTAALRVTPTQRFRTTMPGWGFKIKEKPGEGEYRYLRFAWKKKGGNNILLQLNANNNWGPTKGAAGPAFRYEAGPAGNPYNGAAIRVSDKLPDDWVVVTRDLFKDFGEFALTGLAFTSSPGEFALFDHVYFARTDEDLKKCPPPLKPDKK